MSTDPDPQTRSHIAARGPRWGLEPRDELTQGVEQLVLHGLTRQSQRKLRCVWPICDSMRHAGPPGRPPKRGFHSESRRGWALALVTGLPATWPSPKTYT